MSKIRVIIKDPHKKPRSVNISNTLANLQKTVDGYIETVTLAIDFVVICDEEGLYKNKDFCANICGVDFVGTIILAGINEDEFSDLPIDYNNAKALFPQLWED